MSEVLKEMKERRSIRKYKSENGSTGCTLIRL